ncbi:MAG: hypothetical protein ABI429_00445 [Jatrophihabitantaceae bacterium]
MSTTKIAQRIRARRNAREFERVLNSASPAMRQELIAASSREFTR